MPTLEIGELSVRYGSVQAVRGVSLTVDSAETVVLLGSNGAGKSSTLRAVAGLIHSTGTVRWDGKDISRWPAHRRARAGLVLVPEGRRVFSPLSVEDNLLLGAYTQRSKSRQRATMAEIYDMFPNLAKRRRSNAGLISGGEQQMLAFGRAMMADPAMILMDEPSMGLAPIMVDMVMDAVGAIAGRGIGVLMVEQNAVAALDVARRAAVLERGTIVAQAPAEQLREDPAVLRAFLGSQAVGATRTAS
ncbi:MAG TPA: ABC transporter ATP-binding protein [Amycolatopsis sp.]|nr:ABC transporter ATP-binding protein [Amycolatopsis sp.]